MLEVRGVRSRYGRIEALHGVDLDVRAGEVVALIGANGAGKTTLLRVISGVRPRSAGTVRFDAKPLDAVAAHRRVGLGIAQVPEGRQVFAPLSVESNLRLGAWSRRREAGVEADLQAVYDDFPALAEKRHAPAGGLSGGQQQMLAIGRALMSRPRLLLLDEPSMGLAPIIVDSIFAAIGRLRERGLTILLVEQNARRALEVSDRGYVMEVGVVSLSGESRALLSDARVCAAYLGL